MFFFFSFSLPLTSILQIGKQVVTASEAVQVLSCLLLSSKGLCEVFICRAPYCQRLENRSYGPLHSTFNNTLMAGRRAKASILVPKTVQTEVKVDGKSMMDESDYFWNYMKNYDLFFHVIDTIFSSYY